MLGRLRVLRWNMVCNVQIILATPERCQTVRDAFGDLGSFAQLHEGLPEALAGFESTASRLFSHISALFCIPAQRPRCFSQKLRPSTAGAM